MMKDNEGGILMKGIKNSKKTDKHIKKTLENKDEMPKEPEPNNIEIPLLGSKCDECSDD